MAENTITNPAEITENDNLAYINVIQDLKDNSVDRKLYNKLKDERDALIQSLANGETLATAGATQERTLAECREAFLERTNSDCERVEKLLALREAAIREGEPDPFVASGHHLTPTPYDYQRAQELADIYRECLDYADGDDKVFVNEIQRRMR